MINQRQCSVFHLAHKKAPVKLNIQIHGKSLKCLDHPVYLGVTLHRWLTFAEHLKKVTAKIQAQVNLVKKLTNSKWGADFNTLRISTLALVFSTAKYAAPSGLRAGIKRSINVSCPGWHPTA